MVNGIGHVAFNVKDMEKMHQSRALILTGSVGHTIRMVSKLS